jgi:hypothetical protein
MKSKYATHWLVVYLQRYSRSKQKNMPVVNNKLIQNGFTWFFTKVVKKGNQFVQKVRQAEFIALLVDMHSSSSSIFVWLCPAALDKCFSFFGGQIDVLEALYKESRCQFFSSSLCTPQFGCNLCPREKPCWRRARC